MKNKSTTKEAIQTYSVTVEWFWIALFFAKNINNILHFQSKLAQINWLHSIRSICGVMNKNTLIIVSNLFMIVEKVKERLLSYWMQKVLELRKIKNGRTQMFMQFLN